MTTGEPGIDGDYLAFLGRELRIAAKIDDADWIYFKGSIEPLRSNPLVEFIGEIDATRCFGDAAGLLFPDRPGRAFGMVMSEAMACGTPVFA